MLAAPEADIFDGIVFDTSVRPGGHRFVDAPEVDEIYERGVVLKIDAAAAAESLPKPTGVLRPQLTAFRARMPRDAGRLILIVWRLPRAARSPPVAACDDRLTDARRLGSGDTTTPTAREQAEAPARRRPSRR